MEARSTDCIWIEDLEGGLSGRRMAVVEVGMKAEVPCWVAGGYLAFGNSEGGARYRTGDATGAGGFETVVDGHNG